MNTPLRVLSLALDSSTHSINPHVRYLQPDNILQDMYKIIGCHLVTCTQIQVNGQYFDIWSDDEALFNSPLAPSLYINDDFVLFGNLIFAKSDNEGKFVGLDFNEPQMLYHFAQSQFPKLIRWLQKLKK